MGLSATSLRIAMLTARKSSLEFEGQQINQQRLTLSNQTAALFNSMLTMQVPTPPDPNEFSKMVYTFNAGYGESQILNVTRNKSGGYLHNVTYKSPKTDSVLMKKQLNNVGFRYVNGQMSAVIDGMNYGLTLNGDEEKLNEYIEKKATYDNIKNIENQIASLDKLPDDKVLTSSQMKQYFETLGLSQIETPQATVEDVETTDDAFYNLFNDGNDYTTTTVELTYTASTSPINVNDKVINRITYTNQLTCTTGTLSGSYEDGYTYTTTILPNGSESGSGLEYTISKDSEGEWSWTIDNFSTDMLGEIGINYSSSNLYGHNNKEGEFVEGFNGVTYEHDGKTYSNIIRNGDNTWNWQESSWQQSNNEYNYYPPSQSTPLNLEENTPIEIDENTYLPTYENGQWIFTTNPERITSTLPVVLGTNPFELDEDNILYDIDSDGNIEKFEWNNDANSYTYNSLGFEYSIYGNNTDGYILTNSSQNRYGINQEYSEDDNYFFYTNDPTINNIARNLDAPKDMEGYWYNTKGYVACQNNALVSDKNMQSFINENNEEINLQYSDDWVYVSYNNSTKQWQYDKQLTQFAATFNGRNYTSEDNGQTYQYNDTGYNSGNGRTCILSKDEEDNWRIQYRYTEGQLGIRKINKVVEKKEPKTGMSQLPPGLQFCTISQDVYTFNDEEVMFNVDSCSAANVGSYTIQKIQNSNNFVIKGNGLPPNVNENKIEQIEEVSTPSSIQGISNGVSYTVVDNGGTDSNRYQITAKFNAWVKNGVSASDDDNQDGYSYNTENHSLTLTPPDCVVAQMLWRDFKNERDEAIDTNITVAQMISFFESVLNNFGSYNSSSAYKTKLDIARNNYQNTIDAKGVENPGENQTLFNFIDANGKTAYLFVPLDYVNKDGQVDSTYAYLYSTTFLEGQTQTNNQNANVIYDENGRIAKITFEDGTVIVPEVKMEQDEEAYNAAMIKYEYQKQVYDKEIQDINAKTEVIAQQDKNLELKLKSIDTQHSAVETELEALKKVLDNNVKSSFGTFNA